MRTHAEEFRKGYYRDLPVGDGASVQILARHTTRNRIPRGHEMMRSMVRNGGRIGLVEETTYEWTVSFNRRPIGTIRVNPNGNFYMGPMSFRNMTLEQAAMKAAERYIVAFRQARQDKTSPSADTNSAEPPNTPKL